MSTIVIDGRNPVTVGVDIGQIHDSTALSVSEVIQEPTGKFRHITDPTPAYYDTETMQFVPPHDADPVLRSHYYIRHITRLPLGTSYPDVALHIAEMLCNPMFARRNVRVLIDVTGVGRPVYDDLRKEIDLRREVRHIQLKPITFSHGEKYNRSTGVLAKAFLVSRLQSLLQGHRVHAPDTAEVKATIEELRVYEIKVDDSGKDTYGASIGKHDDLATSLGLGCLEDPWGEMVTYSGKRVY